MGLSLSKWLFEMGGLRFLYPRGIRNSQILSYLSLYLHVKGMVLHSFHYGEPCQRHSL